MVYTYMNAECVGSNVLKFKHQFIFNQIHRVFAASVSGCNTTPLPPEMSRVKLHVTRSSCVMLAPRNCWYLGHAEVGFAGYPTAPCRMNTAELVRKSRVQVVGRFDVLGGCVRLNCSAGCPQIQVSLNFLAYVVQPSIN